ERTTARRIREEEAFRITRQRDDESATRVTRWMRFDSLGRMLLKVEPNTSAGFVVSVLLPPSGERVPGLRCFTHDPSLS
ncbi:MAG: hypothetical protein MUF64_18605, partial [Polyangiaceae bacterium]|nr:hypothetical protein [Polyangiaceae bacterium]